MRKILIVLAIIGVLASISVAYQKYHEAFRSENELVEERYMRMVAEEALENTKVEMSSLKAEFDRTQNKLNALEKKLEQTAALNIELKKRLDSADQTNTDLVTKLKKSQDVLGDAKINKSANEI